jgi:hypothetical protein
MGMVDRLDLAMQLGQGRIDARCVPHYRAGRGPMG